MPLPLAFGFYADEEEVPVVARHDRVMQVVHAGEKRRHAREAVLTQHRWQLIKPRTTCLVRRDIGAPRREPDRNRFGRRRCGMHLTKELAVPYEPCQELWEHLRSPDGIGDQVLERWIGVKGAGENPGGQLNVLR